MIGDSGHLRKRKVRKNEGLPLLALIDTAVSFVIAVVAAGVAFVLGAESPITLGLVAWSAQLTFCFVWFVLEKVKLVGPANRAWNWVPFLVVSLSISALLSRAAGGNAGFWEVAIVSELSQVAILATALLLILLCEPPLSDVTGTFLVRH